MMPFLQSQKRSLIFVMLVTFSSAAQVHAVMLIQPTALSALVVEAGEVDQESRDAAALAAFATDREWQVPIKGETRFAKHIWTREDQGSGVEMFTRIAAATGPREEKRVVLREAGLLNSTSRFALWPAISGTTPESSAALLFDKYGWTSFSRCRDEGKGIGRVCSTVTPSICAQANRDRIDFTPADITAIERGETRAISLILTLRGQDHQLDNVVRFGNRMGLKDPGQTTKGRLSRATKYPNFARDLRVECLDLLSGAVKTSPAR